MTLLNHGLIQVANSKVFAKLGNGTVRDLTLDTNTVYTHPTTKQCSYSVSVVDNLTSSSTTAALSANQGRLLNSSVSNGKTQVANAITGKGIAASGSDSFATLANKISQISSKDASEYKNAKSYLCNSNSGGDFLVPALGYTPSLFLCFMKRAIDESNYCPAALCDFLRNKNDSTLGFDHTNTNSLFSGYVDDSSTYTSSIPAETYAAHTVRVARPYEWQYHYEYSQVYLTVIF